MVKALAAVAVTVVEPPSDTLLPLIVIALLTRPPFGSPVQLVKTPEAGVPKAGVTRVGLLDNTLLPEPVEVVTPVPPRATGSVPVVPPSIGSPVALVSVPLEGVPSTPPLTTGAPAEPTLTARAVATPVPRPEMPVDTGKPVTLVITPLAGVPSAGVTRVGLVANTKAPEPVSPVTAAAKLAELGVPKNVATPAPKAVRPVPPEAAASGEASVRLDR